GYAPRRIAARSSSATRAPVTPSRTWGWVMSVRRMIRIPQQHLGVGFVGLAVGEADQLELHAPRAQKVHPALALAGVSADGRLAEDLNALGVQVRDGAVEIVDIERQVVSADIAVTRLPGLPVGG